MVSLKQKVCKAARRHNWVLGQLEYMGHQGYKCPVNRYHLCRGDNTIDVEVQEDGIYRFYVSTEVRYNVELLTTGMFEYGMTRPINIEALFIPQLIIDLINGMHVDESMSRFNAACASITLRQLEDADLRGYMASCLLG